MLDEELRMGARRLTERAHPCAKRARQRDPAGAFGIEAMSSVIGLGYGRASYFASTVLAIGGQETPGIGASVIFGRVRSSLPASRDRVNRHIGFRRPVELNTLRW